MRDPAAGAHSAPTAAAPPAAVGGRLAGVGSTAVLLGVVSLLTDVSSEMVAAVLPLYLTVQVGLTPLQYGLVDGLYQGVAAAVRLVGGLTADRTGRPKAVATTGYAVSAATRLLLLPATTLAQVGAVVALDRAGKGLRTGPRDAMIAATAAPAALGRAFGVHRTLDTLGALSGPLLAFAVLAALPGGFDLVFVLSAAVALVGLAVLVLLVPDVRPGEGVPRPRAADVRRAVTDPAYRRVLVAAALLSAVTVGDGLLYLVLQRRHDLPGELFPLLFVGTSLAYLLLAVPLGRLADRVGRRRVFLAGHLALLGAYLVLLGPGGPLSVGLGALALLGTYYAATDGVLAAVVAPVVPPGQRAGGLAALQTVVGAGRFAAAVGFGALWTATGPVVALAAAAGGLVVALPLAAVLLRPVRGTAP